MLFSCSFSRGLVLLASLIALVQGFVTPTRSTSTHHQTTPTALSASTAIPFFGNRVEQQQQEAFFAPRPPATEPPLELVLMAQPQQKKSPSAGSFFQKLVQQADVHVGRSILQRLFNKAAAAGGEIMTLSSLEAALQTGPFQFLNAEQIQGIYTMADVDDKGYVTSEEWLTAATQTLRPSSA